MKTRYGILLSVLILICSCEKKDFADEILQMQSRPINMTSCEKAFCYEAGNEVSYDNRDSTYKLVIYIDSLSCSPCFVSNMLSYMATVVDFDSVGVNTLFVFEPKQEQEEDLISALTQLAYPVRTIVVPSGNFSSDNPHLPSSSVLHSFLLNMNNEVTVVGNPARNANVKELMLNSVKKRGCNNGR